MTTERPGELGAFTGRPSPGSSSCREQLLRASSAPAPMTCLGLYLLSAALFWKDSILLHENTFKALDQSAQDNIGNFPLAPQDNGKERGRGGGIGYNGCYNLCGGSFAKSRAYLTQVGSSRDPARQPCVLCISFRGTPNPQAGARPSPPPGGPSCPQHLGSPLRLPSPSRHPTRAALTGGQ